ncbi:lipase [Rhodococcus sp. 06-235-1A]|uniref:esterase/lipase family protein n=1 Tax=Rhodococcus sp. 06-235-1A TaxID=2022508 RepID=UPI000B9B9729|nr:alpha/beta fold hydrolase [Rhodococcus sp. 06-235-1A]OZD08060.1 lipase [Rhodococcus sp. 06-235-1A]
MRGQRRSLITLMTAVTAAAALLAPTAHSAPLMPIAAAPEQPDHADAIRYAATNRDAAPPGANDMSCVPSAVHPNPVVLVHGTDATAYSDWAGFSPILRAAGFCVFAINYGASPDGTTNGYGVIEDSAAQLKSMTTSILEATGAAAVDLVGYSQGAAVARYFVNRLGGSSVVGRWVGIASPTYGGTMYGVAPVVQAVPGATGVVAGEFGPGLAQLMAGSSFLDRLNAGGDTVPGVEYTSIATRVDEVIQPYTNALLRDPGAHNIVVQDLCPDTEVAHFTFTYDPTALRLALNALDPANARPPSCVPVPLGSGILDVVLASH